MESVVLLHRLIIEILAVNDEQDLVDRRNLRHQLCSLETRERFARASGVPDVSPTLDSPPLLVIGGDLDPPKDLLSGDDLVRTHDQQHPVSGQHAVLGEHIEQRMLREERLGETNKVLDRRVR